MSSSLVVQSTKQEVLQQFNQFWSMLDDLSQNDPQSYQMFIEKQIKQGANNNALPQPDSCLLTEMLETKKGLLYINVCGWKCVPTPADENKPVCGGRLETDTGEGGEEVNIIVHLQSRLKMRAEGLTLQTSLAWLIIWTVLQDGDGDSPKGIRRGFKFELVILTVGNFTMVYRETGNSIIPNYNLCSLYLDDYSKVDVAFSPAVQQQAQKDKREKDQVHLLALSFTQQQHGLRLVQRTWPRGHAVPPGFSKTVQPPTQARPLPSQTPASLLQQISFCVKGRPEDSTPVQLITSVQLSSGPGDQSYKTKNLIQVISSSVTAQPQQPQHQLTVNSDPRDLSRSLELTVELPKVQSITECHLSILLEVEDMYHLHLELPETVNEESASATFNKKRTLTLQVSIL
ncbi:PIH1 domain-containing protein 2-like [Salvelinus alpinus]|uniref:PIH1 domain-containing protein 2-like n=1 Tax=Salvelinus alpinus TaxID=8036 RepID=UPI0039FD9C00